MEIEILKIITAGRDYSVIELGAGRYSNGERRGVVVAPNSAKIMVNALYYYLAGTKPDCENQVSLKYSPAVRTRLGDQAIKTLDSLVKLHNTRIIVEQDVRALEKEIERMDKPAMQICMGLNPTDGE